MKSVRWLHGYTTVRVLFCIEFMCVCVCYCVGLAMAEHASSKMDHLLLRFIIMSATLAFLLATLPLYSSERQIYIFIMPFHFVCMARTGRVVDGIDIKLEDEQMTEKYTYMF